MQIAYIRKGGNWMYMKRMLGSALACAVVMASAGSVATAENTHQQLSVSPSATTEVPEKVDAGKLRISVVRQLNVGDYYEQWIAGVQEEAERLKIDLDIYNANGDNARQALDMQQAVATKPDAIIIGWGFGDTLKPGIDAARDAGIPMVAYYVQVEPSDEVAVVDQGDVLMMEGILAQLATDLGGGELDAEVIYAYVPGYQALDIRHTVWAKFLEENPGVKTVATIGVVNPNTAAQTADQAKAALTANRGVKAIIAPWDEFAKGASLAVEELGLQEDVKVYGIDISTADISVMTKPDSPWVITATTDATNVGSVVLRAAALKAVDQLEGRILSVPPLLVRQEALLSEGIKNMDQLSEKFPGLRTPELLSAPWMESMK